MVGGFRKRALKSKSQFCLFLLYVDGWKNLKKILTHLRMLKIISASF